jgi:hypothetical protein
MKVTKYIWDLYKRIGKLTEPEFQVLQQLVCPQAQISTETAGLVLEYYLEGSGIPRPDTSGMFKIPTLREIVLWTGVLAALLKGVPKIKEASTVLSKLWKGRKLWTKLGKTALRALSGLGIAANLWGEDAIEYITEQGLLGSEFLDDVIGLFIPTVFILDTLGDLGVTVERAGKKISDWADNALNTIDEWINRFNIFEDVVFTYEVNDNGVITTGSFTFDPDIVFAVPVFILGEIIKTGVNVIKGIGEFLGIVGGGLAKLDDPETWVPAATRTQPDPMRDRPGTGLLPGETPRPIDFGISPSPPGGGFVWFM